MNAKDKRKPSAGAKKYGHKSHIGGGKRGKKFIDRVLDTFIKY